MDTTTVKEKANWKKWDELLIDAWQKDGSMGMAIRQFLEAQGISVTEMPHWKRMQELFAEHGVLSRAPKIYCHTLPNVRAFFYQFFPKANDLLWGDKPMKALEVLRKYKITEKDLVRGPREVVKIKKEFAVKSSSSDPRLIPGTNAIGIRDARRSAGDWSTVKPSTCSRRTRRSR